MGGAPEEVADDAETFGLRNSHKDSSHRQLAHYVPLVLATAQGFCFGYFSMRRKFKETRGKLRLTNVPSVLTPLQLVSV